MKSDRDLDALEIADKQSATLNLVSLGEVMLRLDPGDMRIATTRQFQVFEGVGEYSVALGLRRCSAQRTAIVTVLADNAAGRLVEDLVLQGGVDTRYLRWLPYDGVGRSRRNGLNFTDRAFGVRAALGCSDRGNTAVSQIRSDRLGCNIFECRSQVASYRRHLLRAVGIDSAGMELVNSAAPVSLV